MKAKLTRSSSSRLSRHAANWKSMSGMRFSVSYRSHPRLSGGYFHPSRTSPTFRCNPVQSISTSPVWHAPQLQQGCCLKTWLVRIRIVNLAQNRPSCRFSLASLYSSRMSLSTWVASDGIRRRCVSASWQMGCAPWHQEATVARYPKPSGCNCITCVVCSGS